MRGNNMSSLLSEIESFQRGFVVANSNEAIIASDKNNVIKRNLQELSLEKFVTSFLNFRNLKIRSYPLGINSAIIILGEIKHSKEEGELLLSLTKEMKIDVKNHTVSALIGIPLSVAECLIPANIMIRSEAIKKVKIITDDFKQNLDAINKQDNKKNEQIITGYKNKTHKMKSLVGISVVAAVTIAIIIPLMILPGSVIIDVTNDYHAFANDFQLDNKLNNQGDQHYHNGEYEEAIVWYDKKLETDQNNIIILNNKGTAFSAMEIHEEAIVWYDKALQVDSEHIITLNNKGLALYSMGEYEEAIVWYDKALQVDPNYQNALQGKGITAYSMGEYEEAIVWYDKALQVDSEHIITLNNKGLALYSMGEYEEAIVWYDKALQVDSEHIITLNNKGLALYSMGEYEEAIVWYDKALQVDPNYQNALHNIKFAKIKMQQ